MVNFRTLNTGPTDTKNTGEDEDEEELATKQQQQVGAKKQDIFEFYARLTSQKDPTFRLRSGYAGIPHPKHKLHKSGVNKATTAPSVAASITAGAGGGD